MSDHSVHKAGETISVNAWRPDSAPTGDEREIQRWEIVSQAREIGSRVEDTNEEEVDSLLDEAITDIRGRRG
jgi:hypothetical protein